MFEDNIKAVVEQFALEMKKIYGEYLRNVILYGSCARGDFSMDSDIDIMVLLDIPPEEIGKARRQMIDVTDKLDLDYDVVLAPVIQSYQLFQQYISASKYYQNVQREGVWIA